jgi:hypothetical protein
MDDPTSPFRMARSGLPLVLLTLGIGACSRERVVQGACGTLEGSQVCMWERVRGNTVIAFGFDVPMPAIDSAPADVPMVWPPIAEATIRVSEVVKAATGFDNITIFWEPHGHPPGPYLVPHFDFHLNTIPATEVGAIDCTDATRPARLPDSYELPDVEMPGMGTLVGLCVPRMGMHALLRSELHASTPFEKAMVVGYYRGRPIFLEPMIARATLLARRSFPLPIPRVPDAPPAVRYPTRFAAEYDSTAQAYHFVFSGLSGTPSP